MFKKFDPKADISGQSQLKSSAQRHVRAEIVNQYPILGENEGQLMEQIWPKKESSMLVKCKDHISMYTVNGEALFIQQKNGPFFPTLRVLHRYPGILPHVQVDRGAIPYLLSGAHMMCPGFTSAGGRLPSKEAALAAGTPVAIHCEGKEHAAAVGITKLGTEEIKKVNKGVGVELVTYVGDDLWLNKQL